MFLGRALFETEPFLMKDSSCSKTLSLCRASLISFLSKQINFTLTILEITKISVYLIVEQSLRRFRVFVLRTQVFQFT